MESTVQKENILWQGKIALRKWGFATSKYGIIRKEGILIKKNVKENSKILHDIKQEDIISLTFPKFGAEEVLLTGFKGFVLKYREGGKIRLVSFWAKGFGAYPDQKEMEKLTEAVAHFSGRNVQEVKETANVFTFWKYMLVFLPMIAGFFMVGFFGALIMGGAGFLALYIYNRKDVSKSLKILSISGILGGGCFITFIVMIILGVGIAFLSQSK
jgi:hypothetical protein